MIDIYDDFFDERFLHNFFPIINNIPLTANNTANREGYPYGDTNTHRLFGTQIFQRENLNRVTVLNSSAQDFFDIFEQIQVKLNQEFYLHYISLNCQHQHCEGSFHTDGDSNQKTIMLMLNPTWESKWGGEFEIQDPFAEGTRVYQYKPGRVLVFPSHLKHRGHAPTKEYGYRYTVVFRVK